MKIRSVTVRIITVNEVSDEELQEYVHSAIEHWGGQLAPYSPLFTGNKAVVDTTVKQSRFCDNEDVIADRLEHDHTVMSPEEWDRYVEQSMLCLPPVAEKTDAMGTVKLGTGDFIEDRGE